MGKAAQRLNTTQPRSFEDNDALGVRLLDRSQKGVERSSHPRGRALLHCAAAIFDDLRQGVRNIAFLRDPTSGEIKVGTNEAFIAGQWRGAKSIRLERWSLSRGLVTALSSRLA
jgi:DNA-binding transcriptional LysR family regulator